MSEAKSDPAPLKTIEIQQLLALLPHRFPFLMIDRVVEVDGDRTAVGIKNVTATEPHFQGHFPGRPVMPGVLILEAMAQTAGAISILAAAGGLGSGLIYLVSIDGAKFRRPVVPGDTLRIRVTKIRQRLNLWKFHAEATVDGVVVAEAEVSSVVTEAGPQS